MDCVLPKFFASPLLAATSLEVVVDFGPFVSSCSKSDRRNLGDPNEPNACKFSVDFEVIFVKVVVSLDDVFVSFEEEALFEAGDPGMWERFSVETVLEQLFVSFVSSIITLVTTDGVGEDLLSAFLSLLLPEPLKGADPKFCVSAPGSDLPSGFVLSVLLPSAAAAAN